MKTLLVTNRKGGVGKSTTTVALAAHLAKAKKRVLVVDLDTQGHVQYGFGIRHTFRHGIHSALMHEDVDLEFLVQKTSFERVDFIPANINFDSSILKDSDRLKKLLDSVANEYDLCLLDTAPVSDGMLQMAMRASDYVLVPMKTEHLGLVGTLQFIKIFYQTASHIHADFTFLGVVPTQYNHSIKEHSKTLALLKDVVGKKRVFSPIRRDVNMTKMFHSGVQRLMNKRSRALSDYADLAHHVIERTTKR